MLLERSSALFRPRSFRRAFVRAASSSSVSSSRVASMSPWAGSKVDGKETIDRLETLPSTPPTRSSSAAAARRTFVAGDAYPPARTIKWASYAHPPGADASRRRTRSTLCHVSGLFRKCSRRGHRPAPDGSRTGRTRSPRFESAPPVKTTASAPVWSHHVAARVFGLPFAVISAVAMRPEGRAGAGSWRGCSSTCAPGGSAAACSGVVTVRLRLRCR